MQGIQCKGKGVKLSGNLLIVELQGYVSLEDFNQCIAAAEAAVYVVRSSGNFGCLI
jgi:hypothetical protein